MKGKGQYAGCLRPAIPTQSRGLKGGNRPDTGDGLGGGAGRFNSIPLSSKLLLSVEVSCPLSVRLLFPSRGRPTAMPIGLLSSIEDTDSGEVTVSLFNRLLRSLLEVEEEAGLVKRLSLGLKLPLPF